MKSVSVSSVCQEMSELPYFKGENAPIPLHALSSDTSPILALVVGENASGKSFIRRVVKQILASDNIECIDISVEGRRQVAYNPMLAFVYGDESSSSTGANSANTILGAIKTSRARTTPHFIFWDEPDLGLSEGWSACAGREIAAFLQNPPEYLRGVFLVSHSKSLLREVQVLNPLFIGLGNPEVATLHAWLSADAPRYESLIGLQNAGDARFRALSICIKERKKNQS